MFEMRHLTREEREEYDRIFFDATHDSGGETYPTREFGSRLRSELESALGSGKDWPQWLINDILEDGLKRRGKQWLKQSEFISVNGGDSVVVKKHARMGIMRALNDAGDKGYQQVLWSDMSTRELLQVISAANKSRKSLGLNIATARRLLDLCEKHNVDVVSTALTAEGVGLEQFLLRSA